MTRRRTIILASLLVVGLASFVAQIRIDDDLTWCAALLGLGTEGLKTAILFVVIDYLIGDHERIATERANARTQLAAATGEGSDQVNSLLNEIEVGGEIHAWNLSPGTTLPSVDLKDRHIKDSHWRGAILDRCSVTDSKLTAIRAESVSFHRTVVEATDFSSSSFVSCDLTGVLFSGCTFIESSFDDADGAGARFDGCTFDAASAEYHPIPGAQYSNCTGVPDSTGGRG